MWFASMSSAEEYPWTLNLVCKLLHNDRHAVGLFATNPFPDSPPKYIRAVLYRYSFAKPHNPQGVWWDRERVSMWLPPMSANDPGLVGFLKSSGWIQ